MKNIIEQTLAQINLIFKDTEDKISLLLKLDSIQELDLELFCEDYTIESSSEIEKILIKLTEKTISNHRIIEIINESMNRNIALLISLEPHLSKSSIDKLIIIAKNNYKQCLETVIHHNVINHNRPFLMIITDFFLDNTNKFFENM